MLFSIQFPFADCRAFIEDSNKLLLPGWPLPTPDHEFVRGIGPIRIRRKGGVNGWIGEDVICSADNALIFTGSLNFCDSKSELYLELRCAYKRLYFDGGAVGKYEIGVATKAPVKTKMQSWQLKELVSHILSCQVSITLNSVGMRLCSLIGAGKHLASLYHNASSPHGSDTEDTRRYVVSGMPLFFLHMANREDGRVPFWSKPVIVTGESFDLSSCLVPYAGQSVRMWILRELKNSSFRRSVRDLGDAIKRTRLLRVALHRLHAEQEALRLVLRLIINGTVDVKPRSLESDRLQLYFNSTIAKISSIETNSCKLFEPEVVELAREALTEMIPGQRDALLSTLERFDMRRNIFCKIEKYIDEWGSAGRVEIHNYGDTYNVANAGAVGSNATSTVQIAGSGNTVIQGASVGGSLSIIQGCEKHGSPEKMPTKRHQQFPWRVFLSHTSELRMHPVGGSYVDRAEEGVIAAGHVPVSMKFFPAVHVGAEDYDKKKLEGCNVYVGIYGLRWGSPVRGNPEVSYTEQEFDFATAIGIPRLIFTLDTSSTEHGLPAEALVDFEYATKQQAFLSRVRECGLITKSYKNPDDLRWLVERSLRELIETMIDE